MRGEIFVVVSAGVEVERVRDATGGEDLVEVCGTGFETVIVMIAAVKIDVKAGETDRAG